MTLRDYQADALNSIETAFESHRSALAVLATGMGKAQPLHSKVLTPSGFVFMGDIRVGDLVIGSDGKPTAVLGVYPQGTKNVLTVHFNDRTTVECCEDHLWSVQTKSQKHRTGRYEVRRAADLIGDLVDGGGNAKWFVPILKPVEFESHDLPIDPYLLGVLLGDGGIRHRTLFSSVDEYIVERVRTTVAAMGLHLRHCGGCDYAITHGVPKLANPLKELLKSLGLFGSGSHEKFIPDAYKFADISSRVELLRGLMDTDGHVRPKDAHAEFSTTSVQLAVDVCDLVRSLGGVTRVRIKAPGKYTHKDEKREGRLSYRVTVSLEVNPFAIDRKAALYKTGKNQGRTKTIVAIEKSREEECQCIKVAAPDSLYVTDGYTLTHNTVLFTEVGHRHPGRKIVICPFLPLIEQAANKIRQRTGVQPDIEQADQRAIRSGWAANEWVVASKETLKPHRLASLTGFTLAVFDEAHLFQTAHGRAIANHFLEQGAKNLFVTATPKRADKKAMGQLAEVCAYQKEIDSAVEDGWLVAPKAKTVTLKSLDLSNVATGTTTHGRDFVQEQLNEQLETYETVAEIAEVTAREYMGEKTAIYCSSVQEAKLVAERLSDVHKVRAGWICSDEKLCPKVHRREVMRQFTGDGIDVLANVGMLTTGWDFPGLKHIVMARPTKSLSLYTQILGRGTRALPGVVDFDGSNPELRRAAIAASDKPFFRVTDLVDVTHEHKLVSCVDVLGGHYDQSVVDAVRKDLEDGKESGGPMDELLAAKKAELQAIAEEKERKKRARIAAKVDYETRDVDVFGGARMTSKPSTSSIKMPFGKHKGSDVRAVPRGYLRWVLEQPWPKEGIRKACAEVLGVACPPRPIPTKQPTPPTTGGSLFNDGFPF
jgi:superfamily II DNA or RNA helicase